MAQAGAPTHLHSCWSAIHGGPQHLAFLGKLERLGRFQALELRQERFLWLANEKRVGVSFLVLHQATEWEALQVELLAMARAIYPTWVLTLYPHECRGLLSPQMQSVHSHHTMPLSGLVQLNFEIRADQQYHRPSWLNGLPDRW